jgi:hypothetical protein
VLNRTDVYADSKGQGWGCDRCATAIAGRRSDNGKIYIHEMLPRVARQLQGQTTQRRK